mmetsp:Transcript_9214/g.20550  ORF Transcript_9214/g.20550 Transcript_9214/m.20550 type:complete len:362 (+) Transcript_9214:46-1131(+)
MSQHRKLLAMPLKWRIYGNGSEGMLLLAMLSCDHALHRDVVTVSLCLQDLHLRCSLHHLLRTTKTKRVFLCISQFAGWKCTTKPQSSGTLGVVYDWPDLAIAFAGWAFAGPFHNISTDSLGVPTAIVTSLDFLAILQDGECIDSVHKEDREVGAFSHAHLAMTSAHACLAHLRGTALPLSLLRFASTAFSLFRLPLLPLALFSLSPPAFSLLAVFSVHFLLMSTSTLLKLTPSSRFLLALDALQALSFCIFYGLASEKLCCSLLAPSSIATDFIDSAVGDLRRSRLLCASDVPGHTAVLTQVEGCRQRRGTLGMARDLLQRPLAHGRRGRHRCRVSQSHGCECMACRNLPLLCPPLCLRGY